LTPTRRWAAVAATLATLVLCGCAATVTGSGHGSGTGSPPTDFPVRPPLTTTPPTTPAPGPGPTTTAPSLKDIVHVGYSVPRGFVRNTEYREDVPNEAKSTSKYLIPAGITPGRDVIAIVLYRLPAGQTFATRDEQIERIHHYERKRHVTVVGVLTETVIDGRRAFGETVTQPAQTAPFRYTSIFVFGSTHVLQISCQVDKYVAQIKAGCNSLATSVHLS